MKIQLSQPYSFHQLGQRQNQEDARFPDVDKPSKERAPFFVVCDGVGGQDKGERASRTVCDAFGEQMEGFDLAVGFDGRDFSSVFSKVYDVFSQVASSECETMATTLTFVCFHKNGYMAAHCGDSRIYHIRPGQGIVYMSEDHSLVQQMVRNGIIRPEEAESHPQSNIITRCIMLPQGEDDAPKASVLSSSDVRKGDYFFLCSDGVVHQVSDDQLVEVLEDATHTDEEKIKLLAQCSADSTDNNTAYLLHVEDVEAEENDSPNKPVIQDISASGEITGTGMESEEETQEIKVKSPSLMSRIKGALGL